MDVNTVWVTPNGEELLAKMARVSNPANENNKETSGKLIKYLIDHEHWSPFEMVNVCMEIKTTRDIGRQLLRHRSFTFQEFSQRYSEVLEEPVYREARIQDPKNRQNSVESDNIDRQDSWLEMQKCVMSEALVQYQYAIRDGIAKEVARAILPEGMTPTRMYMNGTLRSWIHFTKLRTGNGTQKECREVAEACLSNLYLDFPVTMKEVFRDE